MLYLDICHTSLFLRLEAAMQNVFHLFSVSCPGLSFLPASRTLRNVVLLKSPTLPNGLRIASDDALGPAACVGIYVNCGSIYVKESIGVSHLLERLSFKSTKNRSHLKIVHNVEKTGGNVSASASREQMGYSYDTLRTYLPEAVELLVDCVRNPLFLDSEVEEQLTLVKREIGEIKNDPQRFLLESLLFWSFGESINGA